MKLYKEVDTEPERLDIFIAQNCEDRFSRSSIAKLIKQGRVTLNDKPVSLKSTKVESGDTVNVDYEDPVADDSLEVLYEDDDLVVVNKPAGMLSHSKGPITHEVSVADWLQPKTSGLDRQRSGIAHRLDRATSGVMILAKNADTKSWLMKQFSDRNVDKKYLAVIEGVPESKKFIVDMPIGRNPRKLTTFYVTDSGRPSQTGVEVLDSNGKESLVLLSPKTGRTHQLRVHMWANGWPILGDPFYKEDFKEGEDLLLHAYSLSIQIGPNDWKDFSAPLPAHFESKLKELGLEFTDI